MFCEINILGQLDFQNTIHCIDADILISQCTCSTALDIQPFIDLFNNGILFSSSFFCSHIIITGIFLAIVHGSHFMVALGITVNDAASLFFAVDGGILIRIQGLCTVISAEINGYTIFTISPFRTSETDMAYAVLTGKGDRIFAVFPCYSHSLIGDSGVADLYCLSVYGF